MIGTRIERISRQYPDLPALTSRSGTVSYRELLSAAAWVRSALEQRGAGEGRPVAVSLPVGGEAVIAFAGCALAGAIYVPVNPEWRDEELGWLIAQVNPSAAIVGGDDAPRWLAAGLAPERVLLAETFETPAGDSPTKAAVERSPEDPFAYTFSSGTTGHPKIIVKRPALATRLRLADEIPMQAGDATLTFAPFHFGFSLIWNLLLPLVVGGHIVLLERFDPETAAAAIERHQVGCLTGSPAFYGLMTDADLRAFSFDSLKACFTGGASTSAVVQERWRRLAGQRLRQAYGTVESGLITCGADEEAPPNCVGRVFFGVEVRILAGGEQQAPGCAGEIAVRGPDIMQAYLNDPEATAARFTDGFLRTGDAGWLDEEGRLFLTGRIQPWINTGGVKVDPLEVQTVLRALPGVRDCLVRAEAGPRGMDIIAAMIASEAGVELTRADVIRHCRGRLAQHKIPRAIHFVSSLAKDLTGKSSSSWS